MFGGPGSWLHTYVGGITNAPGSIGYEHVRFSPPAALIAQALECGTYYHVEADDSYASGARIPGASGTRMSDTSGTRLSLLARSASHPLRWSTATKTTPRGTFAMFWSVSSSASKAESCSQGGEGDSVVVNCTGGGIQEIMLADYGTPTGSCASGVRKGNCTTSNLTKIVSEVCQGQAFCTLECTAHVSSQQFMGCNISAASDPDSGGATRHKSVPMPDPCHGLRKNIVLQARCARGALSVRTTTPANSIATTSIPLMGVSPQDVIATENGTIFWGNGTFIPGVEGIHDVASLGDSIIVHHGSGVYDFRSLIQ